MKSAMLFSIVLVAGLILVQSSLQSADAVKSMGTKTQQYGKHAEIKVCGTYFCATNPSLGSKFDPTKNKPTQNDLNALFNRMDKVEKQHQQKILEQWRLMNNTDKIQFLEVMNQMLSYMESMDMGEHIREMMNNPDALDHGHMMMPEYKGMHHMHDNATGDSEDSGTDNKQNSEGRQ